MQIFYAQDLLVKVETKLLKDALKKVKKVQGGNHSTLPILDNVKISCTKSDCSQLDISCNNLDMELIMQLDIHCHTNFEILVNLKALKKYVDKEKSPHLSLVHDTEKDNLIIQGGKRSCSLPLSLALDEYPVTPFRDHREGYETWFYNASYLIDSLKYVSLAVSQDATRYVLNGVYFDKMVMVATDGRRLHLLNDTHVIETPFILGIQAIDNIISLTNPKGKAVNFSIADNKLVIKGEDFILHTQAIEGKFPNYKLVIPSSFKHDLWIEEESTKDIMEYLQAVKGEVEKVTLSFPELHKIALEAKGEGSTIKQSFTVEGNKTVDIKGIALSDVQLSDALKYLDSFTLLFNDELKPVKIKKGHREMILMPFRLG